MIIIREELCPKDHPCPVVSICPEQAISQRDDFSAPAVDNDRCSGCRKCTSSCGVFLCIGCGG